MVSLIKKSITTKRKELREYKLREMNLCTEIILAIINSNYIDKTH
jgi:hypothetical protein